MIWASLSVLIRRSTGAATWPAAFARGCEGATGAEPDGAGGFVPLRAGAPCEADDGGPCEGCDLDGAAAGGEALGVCAI